MRTQLLTALRRGTSTFGSFTPGQKAVTIAATVALVVGGVLFSNWAARPTYAPLFSNLAPADASAIVEKLDAAKEPYKLTDGGGTILVPKEEVYDLRLKMSGEGLPAQKDSGYSLLDEQGVTTSEFQQHVTYRRALEGEIAKTVESIDGVQQAIVHLAIPEKDVFADDEQKPTASVLVDTAPGKDLSSQQVQAVVNLVASSVEGLDASQVTVADSSGKVLSAAGTGTLGGAGDVRAEQTQAYEKRISDAVVQMLDQVVGPGHSEVKVTADLDYDQTNTHSETYVYDPKVPPLADTKTTETYTGSGAPVGGVLGPDNIQVPAGGGGDQSGYKKESLTRNNAVGKVVEERKAAPGAVRNLDVAVLLDSRAARNISTGDIHDLVAAAVGLDPKRGDTLQVTQLPFDQTKAEQAKKELAEAKKAEKRESLMSLARTGGLVLAVLVIIGLALLSARRRQRRTELTQGELERLDQLQRELEESEARALAGGGAAVPELESAPPADPESDRRTEQADDIAALVEGQPEEVAQLLRGWLADRRS